MNTGLWAGLGWIVGFLLCCGLCAFEGGRTGRKNWEKEIIEGLLAIALLWPVFLVIYAGELLGVRSRKRSPTQPPSPASTNQRPGE